MKLLIFRNVFIVVLFIVIKCGHLHASEIQHSDQLQEAKSLKTETAGWNEFKVPCKGWVPLCTTSEIERLLGESI